jgi:hypothetical protein
MIHLRLFLSLAFASAVLVACTTTDHDAVRCGNIPANGCPLDGPNEVCTDPSCAAAYACNPDGSWTVDHTCPNFQPDAGSEAGQEAGQDSGPEPTVCIDAGLPPGASPIGGNDCVDLQAPDCPLSEVLVCGSSGADLCAATGCQQLFVCEASGWHIWGNCEDGGVSLY